jgi:hypothetical protein
MRPLRVLVLSEFANQVVEMLRATRHEVVEALFLQRLDEPFRINIHIGRANLRSDGRRVPTAQRPLE